MIKRNLCILFAVFYSGVYAADVNLNGEFTVVKVEKVQYNLNGSWLDVPATGFSHIEKGSSIDFKAIRTPTSVGWPNGQPQWSGDASGNGETKTVTFSSSGSRIVKVNCGTKSSNEISFTIQVDQENTSTAINWPVASYSEVAAAGNPNCVEKPFSIDFLASADIHNNVWHLRVKKMTGGATLTIYTGGYRNPIINPPTTEAEAQDAVNDMKDYYTNGRGAWHTPEASRVHEAYHYIEWQCSSEHFWSETERCIELITVSYNSNATETDAINAMKVNALNYVKSFKDQAKIYWNSLSDSPSSRPYACGQLALNSAIEFVQNIARTNGWTVSWGVNTPNASNPCYEAFGIFNLCP